MTPVFGGPPPSTQVVPVWMSFLRTSPLTSMPSTLPLIETISVLLGVNCELLALVPQGLTRKTLLGPMVWPDLAVSVVPLKVIRSLLLLPAAPVDENTQAPGPC